MVIFHKSKASIVGYKVKNDLSIYADSTEISNDDYWLKNYRLLNNIKNTYLNPTANVFTIKGKRLLRIDSTSVYPKDFKSDLILLSGSPDVHLEKLILQNRPELIITDGNNYKSYVEKWKSTAKKHNISFHNTFEKGYIRFNLN
jgi:competence protein ComEC